MAPQKHNFSASFIENNRDIDMFIISILSNKFYDTRNNIQIRVIR